MAYVNIYQYDQFTSVEVKKFIYSGTSTYLVGNIRRGNESVPEQMFNGKLDANGNFLCGILLSNAIINLYFK